MNSWHASKKKHQDKHSIPCGGAKVPIRGRREIKEEERGHLDFEFI